MWYGVSCKYRYVISSIQLPNLTFFVALLQSCRRGGLRPAVSVPRLLTAALCAVFHGPVIIPVLCLPMCDSHCLCSSSSVKIRTHPAPRVPVALSPPHPSHRTAPHLIALPSLYCTCLDCYPVPLSAFALLFVCLTAALRNRSVASTAVPSIPCMILRPPKFLSSCGK
jgi:hypothetical protein